MKRYSQNNEQDFIVKYFKDLTGSFLDLGAYDGITFSNVYALIEKGWKGVCVEASPKVFTKLQSNLKDFNVELLQACVSIDQESIVDWFDNDEATATYIDDNVRKWQKQTPFTRMKMPTIKVDRILDHFGTEFDFVNIDIEGNSSQIFEHLYDRLRHVKMFCVEHDGRVSQIVKCATDHKLLNHNGENLILIHR